MGRTYYFECSRCGHRAKVCGRTDRGLDFYIETILCRDCKRLYDAVTRLRVPQNSSPAAHKDLRSIRKTIPDPPVPPKPPTFDSALGRLPQSGYSHFRWARFKLQCPLSPLHRVEPWVEPFKCPQCGLDMQKNVLPYRIWD